MKTQQCALIAAVALALTACNRPAPAPTWPCRCGLVPVECLGPLQVVFEVDWAWFLALGSSEEPMGDRGCPSEESLG